MSGDVDVRVDLQEDDDRVRAFWELAKRHAKLARMPGWFGPSALESVPPPAFTLGLTPAEAGSGLDELLAAGELVIEAALADFGDDPLPEVGTLGIVLDGAGDPQVLVVTGAVAVRDGVVRERLDVVYAANRSSQ